MSLGIDNGHIGYRHSYVWTRRLRSSRMNEQSTLQFLKVQGKYISYDKDVKCRFSSNCKKVCFNSKNQQLVQQKQTKEVNKRTYDSHPVKKETTHPVGSHLRSTPHQQTKHNM